MAFTQIDMTNLQPGTEFDEDERNVTIIALREYINEMQYICEVKERGWEDAWVKLKHAESALSALEGQEDET